MNEVSEAMKKVALERHKAGAFLKGWAGAVETLKEKVQAEAVTAGAHLEEAQAIEKESDYSDAMLSMDRAFAEGFDDALALVIRLLDEVAGE